MKNFVLYCMLLFVGVGALNAQVDTLAPTTPPKRSIFVIPKVEVFGGGLALAYGPMRLLGAYPYKLWPFWIPVSVEVGLGKNISLIGGVAGRLQKINFAGGQTDNFVNASLVGLRFSLAMRWYISGSDGQGIYAQPTAKLVWQHYEYSSFNYNTNGTDTDFIFSTRIGWQKHLVKGLYLDAAVGPGIGIRNEYQHNYYDLGYHFGVGMGEIDNPSVELFGGIGRNWTSITLIGDASLALGWRF